MTIDRLRFSSNAARRPFRALIASVLLGIAAATAGFATPTITSPGVSPSSIPVNTATSVTFTASATDPTIVTTSVNLQQLSANGTTFTNVGTLYDDGTHGDPVAGDGNYTLQTNLTETSPFPVTFRVSAAVRGSLTRIFSSQFTLNVVGATPAVISLSSPQNLAYLNSSPVTVNGTVSDPTATITVNGLPAPVSSGAFTVSVALQEGNNTLTAVATNSQGTISTASLQVTLDTTPPRITIDSPFNGYDTTDSTITVTGKANDTVVGTVNMQQMTITVNGVAATVANRGFQALNVPLALGNNTITAKGIDRAGNAGTAQITVRRDQLTQSIVKIVSGNNQTGAVGAQLSSAIVAGLFDGTGTPVPGQPVVFTVTENNGTLDGGKLVESITTDSNGNATAHWTLGTRSGSGNNIVEATAVGFADSAIFSASGTAGTAAHINVDSGNHQMGAVSQALPYPFVVAMTDASQNRLANVSVTFTVSKGGGSFGGQPSLTTTSDSDGRALAVLTLGPQDGIENNVVLATFPGNTGFPATFSATGHVPGNPASTAITGVVLDNTNNPVPGATIRVYLQNVPAQQSVGLPPNVTAVSDLQGQFTVLPAPVGFVKIIADGSTVTRPGKWPNLEYDLVTVAGQTNTIGLPIYLVPLDTTPADQLCVSATQGGTLTLPSIPGFSLSVLPGAATFPGGSTSGCLTVTAVHPDKIPMVPGFGQQPRFIATLQPAGTLFSPPAMITIPNADGLAPREITEMYSFDHDLATFVSIGTGTVSNDGMVISSDPGVGILKAGWFCGGPPTPTGTCCVPKACQDCQGNKDPSQNGNVCSLSGGGSGVCSDANGNCMAVTPTLIQVTFSGSNFHNVAKDSDGTAYGSPQWTNTSNPFPVSYTMNTTVMVAAQFSLSAAVSSANIMVEGDGPGGLHVQGPGSVSGTTVKFPATAFGAPLPNTINKFNPFQITWQVSLDGGNTYITAGSSMNKMYVTLADPGANANPLFETILDIGTRNATGQSTATGAVPLIWANFASLNVARADGVQMGYWTAATAKLTCQSLPLMLADPGGNGSCIAWAQLLYQTLVAEGITGAQIFEITPIDTTVDNFMVKNWTFDKHIRSGPNGVSDSATAADDFPVFPKGTGYPANQPCIGPGANGKLDTAPSGDDMVSGNQILTGPDGVCNSKTVGDDVQLLAAGSGPPNMPAITPGANGTLDSAAAGDDTLQDGLFAGNQYPYMLFTGTSVFGPFGVSMGDVARQPGIPGQRNSNPPRFLGITGSSNVFLQ